MRRMKRLSFVWLLLGVLVIAPSTQAQLRDEPDDSVLVAKRLAEWLDQGDLARVIHEFAPETREMLPQDKLDEVWHTLTRTLGPYHGAKGVHAEQRSDGQLIVVRCAFERAAVDMKVAFNKKREVNGLWFVPVQPGEESPQPPPSRQSLRTPEPVAEPEGPPPAQEPIVPIVQPASSTPDPSLSSTAAREREVVVGSGMWALPGTLTLPAGEGPFPAVVLVHGSGPHDRDETIGPNKPFRDLAEGLAARRIAALRYEKRTKAHALEMATAKDAITVKEETIDDVLVAVELLRHTERIDPRRIYVLGHSLGGMLIPRIGLRDPKIAGLIVLAGNTRPMEDLIVEQTTYITSLDGIVSKVKQDQLEQIKQQAARIKDPHLANETALPPPFGVPASYWLDLRDYRPAEAAIPLTQPMLILQGERDYQVTMEDFNGWKRTLSAKSSVTFKTYPALNHLFIEGQGRSVPAEYARAGHVAEFVIDDIAQWIERVSSAPAKPANPVDDRL